MAKTTKKSTPKSRRDFVEKLRDMCDKQGVILSGHPDGSVFAHFKEGFMIAASTLVVRVKDLGKRDP
jgi:hypothetical protein